MARRWTLVVAVGLSILSILAACEAAEPVSPDALASSYQSDVKPLLRQFCFECHAQGQAEADVDLQAIATTADVEDNVGVWLKVRTMLHSRQMPPVDSPQLSDGQHAILYDWVTTFLRRQAEATAGDPGPVILRRLNNEEYNYTVRDLTGVASLDPTREFPVDGAAGEGFINTGSAQAMSPSLVTKYLDAAKEVASHAVLTPDGMEFSDFTSRRDWTDERVARIRQFYDRYTVSDDVYVEVGGAGRIANQGGAIPLSRYFAATLAERQTLLAGTTAIDEVAKKRGLSNKYLARLWDTLNEPRKQHSLLLDPIREQWHAAGPTDVDKLVEAVGQQQTNLWQYNVIGHVGSDGEPIPWMVPVDPIAFHRDFGIKLPSDSQGEVSVFLAASDAGDGSSGDYVVWKNARLTSDNGPDILLRDVAGIEQQLQERQRALLAQTKVYLAAAAALERSSLTVTEVAQARGLDVKVLATWASYLDVGPKGPVVVTGHFQETETHVDYPFIRSWGTGATPIVTANSSDMQVRLPGIARPHAVTAHPSPTLFVAIGWRSPFDGPVKIEAQLSDAHPECGDGQEWFLQHRTSRSVGNLWKGRLPTGGAAKSQLLDATVGQGELISLIVGPGGNHSCDLTEVNFTITELGGQQRVWDLAQDVSADLLASNPHSDRFGNKETWHFYKGELPAIDRTESPTFSVPSMSLLGQWRAEQDAAKKDAMAAEIERLAVGNSPADVDSPNGSLYRQLQELMLSVVSEQSLVNAVEGDPRFGRHPLGDDVPATDLVVQAPKLIEFRIPAWLAAGRTLVVRAELDSRHGCDGTVRIEAGLNRVDPNEIGSSSPVVVHEGSEAHRQVLAGFEAFRALFPSHVCYDRIVPVDEVVTLTLFYRQDEALQRLMLSDLEIGELNKLWDNLLYVTQEPLRFEVAFEQIREFATQDRPDLVTKWDPLKPTVVARADAFRKRLIETEPHHLRGVVEFAGQAWRRPLVDDESREIERFYGNLRKEGIDHEPAIQLTLARILASPDFLYRREVQPNGAASQTVSAVELANRLSYFLWSSMPDAELFAATDGNALLADDVLKAQTERMLKDSKTRRLAVQFAAQWLHLRNFDKNNDKNESLYPEFAHLRDDMYEETVLFFEDMFRNDRSILELLGADYTFLNEALARHYGVDDIVGPEWRQVDDVNAKGRGGVLGMAALLASQSGASRTSPILRGNWIYETLLGERLPRPPANVPQLPESVPAGLTSRQLIERHSSDPACAKCHVKIDPFGFALEQYDAIGRLRPDRVNTSTRLENGREIEGLEGLRQYLLTERHSDVVRQFCRKLLGYALGREVLLSDELLIDRMQQELVANGHRFSVAVEVIVGSQQFRQIRGRDADWAQDPH